MTYVSQPMNRNCPPIPGQQEIVQRAVGTRDAGWSLFCCTTFVGVNNAPDEYVEPHWLIAAIEAQGWRLERLDYLCVDIDQVEPIFFNGPARPLCRIEAKLMFRRDHPSTDSPAAA